MIDLIVIGFLKLKAIVVLNLQGLPIIVEVNDKEGNTKNKPKRRLNEDTCDVLTSRRCGSHI